MLTIGNQLLNLSLKCYVIIIKKTTIKDFLNHFFYKTLAVYTVPPLLIFIVFKDSKYNYDSKYFVALFLCFICFL